MLPVARAEFKTGIIGKKMPCSVVTNGNGCQRHVKTLSLVASHRISPSGQLVKKTQPSFPMFAKESPPYTLFIEEHELGIR